MQLKHDVILNWKKYTESESFQSGSLVGNIIWIEMYFHIYASAVAGSTLFTEILLILILRGDKKDPPSSENTFGAILSRVFLVGQSKAQKHLSASCPLSPESQVQKMEE